MLTLGEYNRTERPRGPFRAARYTAAAESSPADHGLARLYWLSAVLNSTGGRLTSRVSGALSAERAQRDRVAEAEREGWLGEVEGLQTTLAGAEDKLAQIDHRTGTVDLGIPAVRGA